jgi:ankyrin repeat protein
LENGANPDVTNAEGETPLFVALLIAIRENNPELIKLLLENRANPDATNAEGETPLFIAIRENNPELIQLLLKYRANPDATNAKGETPLSIAIRKKYFVAAKIVMDYGANIEDAIEKVGNIKDKTFKIKIETYQPKPVEYIDNTYLVKGGNKKRRTKRTKKSRKNKKTRYGYKGNYLKTISSS